MQKLLRKYFYVLEPFAQEFVDKEIQDFAT